MPNAFTVWTYKISLSHCSIHFNSLFLRYELPYSTSSPKTIQQYKILNDYFLQHERVYQKISTKYLSIRVPKIRWNRMKVQIWVFYLWKYFRRYSPKILWNIRLWKYQKNILFHWFKNMSDNSNNVLTPDFLQIIKGLMNWRISTLVANFGQM